MGSEMCIRDSHKAEYEPVDFPGAEAYFQHCLSIPMHAALTKVDQDRVVEALAEFLPDNGL